MNIFVLNQYNEANYGQFVLQERQIKLQSLLLIRFHYDLNNFTVPVNWIIYRDSKTEIIIGIVDTKTEVLIENFKYTSFLFSLLSWLQWRKKFTISNVKISI